jgi:antirestriction protein ArdC
VAIPLRSGATLSGGFGSALYAKEELIPEITSAFVCASLGIVPIVRDTGISLLVSRADEHGVHSSSTVHSIA